MILGCLKKQNSNAIQKLLSLRALMKSRRSNLFAMENEPIRKTALQKPFQEVPIKVSSATL